jgi:DNA-binding transcriptional MerR regulator
MLVDVDEPWTLSELVTEAMSRLAALPPPKNGQVRAVPDERTVRYYAAIGLLDRPVGQRGRTALYGKRHLAQIVSIKRLQGADRSLAEIRQLWPTLDDVTLERISGVALTRAGKSARRDFWKKEPLPPPPRAPLAGSPYRSAPPTSPFELKLELAPEITLVVAIGDDVALSLSPADVRALRAAAAPLVAELAMRGLAARGSGTLEEEP